MRLGRSRDVISKRLTLRVAAIALTATCLSDHSANTQAALGAPGSVVSLRELAGRRGIRISAAVNPSYLAEAAYSDILVSEFSGLEPENAMKFASLHPRWDTDARPYDFAAADQLVAFAKAHNIAVRGHTLVWHRQIPDWVTKSNYTAQQLNEILRSHIGDAVAHFGDSVYAYDVVNEAFMDDGSMRSTIWYDQPGIGFAGEGTKYIEQALQWAHAANPKAKLFYNDYDVEAVNKKSDAMYRMALDFVRKGVPLNGVGLQMHVDLGFDDPAKLKSLAENMERFAKLGLEVHVTELDIALSSNAAAELEKQAELYGKIVRACVEQPACKVLQTWGFTDKYSWIRDFRRGYGWALPWDANYKKKPAYAAIENALR
jgi:endo-1,4-beta-xylanase